MGSFEEVNQENKGVVASVGRRVIEERESMDDCAISDIIITSCRPPMVTHMWETQILYATSWNRKIGQYEDSSHQRSLKIEVHSQIPGGGNIGAGLAARTDGPRPCTWS
jgi:hypothetical protein